MSLSFEDQVQEIYDKQYAAVVTFMNTHRVHHQLYTASEQERFYNLAGSTNLETLGRRGHLMGHMVNFFQRDLHTSLVDFSKLCLRVPATAAAGNGVSPLVSIVLADMPPFPNSAYHLANIRYGITPEREHRGLQLLLKKLQLYRDIALFCRDVARGSLPEMTMRMNIWENCARKSQEFVAEQFQFMTLGELELEFSWLGIEVS